MMLKFKTKPKLCSICKKNEAVLKVKSLITKIEFYACTDCYIMQSGLFKEFRQKEPKVICEYHETLYSKE